MRSGPADLQKCLRNRSHFLRRLRSPCEKCELVRELEESRSTIDRALRELERAGFVARDDDGFRTTLAGELALAEHERHVARLDGITSVADRLGALPADAPLDAALFEGADVSLPTRRSPHEPVESLEALVADADHARVFGTTVIPSYVDLYHERIVEGGMTAELVLSERVIEWLLSRREEAMVATASTEGVTVAETDATHSFSLTVVESKSGGGASDRSVGVMIYDEGTLHGFVQNDTREAVAWGDALFDRLAGEAQVLEVA
ncbi:helix-turn-helix transcriptional regulator [Halorussus ruber]|uniref:helix-turn-helix transcriptional regulator n=1 Tax=Halorussus ruber TaxID=1126238 RepID=UPI001091D4D7|nr:ArsR family transcriptional regulator [Halorussus ruber]